MARLARVTRVVELDEDVAGLDPVAVVHAELADHAAGRVLHLLDVGIDDDGACAITAPAISVVAAQPPTPPASSSTISRRRADGAGSSRARCRTGRRAAYRSIHATIRCTCSTCAASSCAGTPASGTTLSGCGDAPRGGRCSTLASTSSFGPEGLRLALVHDQDLVDAGERARPVRDHDDDAAALAHAQDGLVKRLVASASRFELGSSSTTRNGSP